MSNIKLPPLSTESMVRTCSRHPWITIGVWVLVLLLAFALASSYLGDVLTTQQSFTNNPESKRADDILQDRLLQETEKANEVVIVKSATLTANDDSFRRFVEELYGEIIPLKKQGENVVDWGAHYYLTGIESWISVSEDGTTTTILPFIMAGDYDDASDNIDIVHEVVHEADKNNDFQVLITGIASIDKDFQEIAENDLQRGELLGIPFALVILALVFGAIIAAGIPLVLAIVSIVMALGLTVLVGQIFELSFFVTNMITMMGLAIGIDYSLLIVSRYREERRAGLDKLDAIEAAGATANRTVLFSGTTVFFALCGMLIVPLNVFVSLGTGAILVVFSTVLASQTLLPAILSLVGDKIDSWRIPFIQQKSPTGVVDKHSGFWYRIAYSVMRHPIISLVVTMGLLFAAAWPVLDIETGTAGVSSLPDSFQSKRGFLILDTEFSAGMLTPTKIVIDGQIESQPVQSGIQHLEDLLQGDPSFGPWQREDYTNENLVVLSVPAAGDYSSDQAIDAIRTLRNNYIPQAFSDVNAEVLVTGATAIQVDYFDVTDQYTPIVFAFVLGLSFLLLTVVFRSLVVPIKAIIMNLLSVGAAYGLLVLVFQKGVAAGLLGFQKVDTIEAWIPLFLFCILFGLSMDYHVFLLSRIREHFDETHDNSESVAFGLRSTGGIITGAALIMVAVFGGFASGDLVMFQQMGFGLAVAVFLDATIVRSVMVPAAMRLLGALNWYLPSFLHWLPEVRGERTQMSTTNKSDEQPGL